MTYRPLLPSSAAQQRASIPVAYRPLRAALRPDVALEHGCGQHRDITAHLRPSRDGTLGAGTTQKEATMSTPQPTLIAPAILRRKHSAAYIGVCVNTLENLKAEPTFPRPIQISRRSVGYLRADLDAWLESRRQA
jgi:prophage regulatory protein